MAGGATEDVDDVAGALGGRGEALSDAVEVGGDAVGLGEAVHGVEAADGPADAEVPGELTGEHVGGLVATDGQQQVGRLDARALHDRDVRRLADERHDVEAVADALEFGAGGVNHHDVMLGLAQPLRQQLPQFPRSDDDDLHGCSL